MRPDLVIQIGSHLVSTEVQGLIGETMKANPIAVHVLLHTSRPSERVDASGTITHQMESRLKSVNSELRFRSSTMPKTDNPFVRIRSITCRYHCFGQGRDGSRLSQTTWTWQRTHSRVTFWNNPEESILINSCPLLQVTSILIKEFAALKNSEVTIVVLWTWSNISEALQLSAFLNVSKADMSLRDHLNYLVWMKDV